MTVAEQVLSAILSTLVVVVVVLGVSLARVHARLARIEEWIRLDERQRS